MDEQDSRYALMQKNAVLEHNALAEIVADYAVCVIDNPPDINMSVFNALVCTEKIIPNAKNFYSVDGIPNCARSQSS